MISGLRWLDLIRIIFLSWFHFLLLRLLPLEHVIKVLIGLFLLLFRLCDLCLGLFLLLLQLIHLGLVSLGLLSGLSLRLCRLRLGPSLLSLGLARLRLGLLGLGLFDLLPGLLSIRLEPLNLLLLRLRYVLLLLI